MGIARFFFLKKKKKVVVNSNLNVVTRNYTHFLSFSREVVVATMVCQV